MTKAKGGNMNSVDGRHLRHATVLDYNALDQWRVRHELLRQAMMKAQRALRRGNIDGAREALSAALKDDKKVEPTDG